MPLIGEPVGILLVAGTVLLAFVLWLLRARRYPGPRLHGEGDEIDREELEAAEREVRDLDAGLRPEDGFEGDEWGPGAVKRRQ
ncbi:MAG: hypothetical protein ACREMX_17625 [Gemmatimonadales bacterium]